MGVDENWTGRIEKLTRIIQLWSKRELSRLGKIIILIQFLVSELINIMQSIGIPEKVLTDLNKLLYEFIWQKIFLNRKAFVKVKRSVMEGNFEDGVLKIVTVAHLQKAFYLQWVGTLAESAEEKWTYVPSWYVRPFVFSRLC